MKTQYFTTFLVIKEKFPFNETPYLHRFNIVDYFFLQQQ